MECEAGGDVAHDWSGLVTAGCFELRRVRGSNNE